MNLSLAPLQGMTLAFYRNLHSSIFGGIDKYYSPFIATTQKRKWGKTLFKDIMPEINQDIKVVPQLLGNNGVDFRYYASRIVDLGYSEINWNIGCPFPMITNKKKGSGILPYPELIKEVLDEACKDTNYKLTVKMRLGYEDVSEGEYVIKLLNNYPIAELIIHGRVGIQKYAGTVDLESFKKLSSLSKHEITYNGDIFTLSDFKNIQSELPSIKNFMLGRGVLRDPFLPSKINGIEISSSEKLAKIEFLHDSVFEHYKNILSGDKHLCDKMKEFWSYMYINIDPNGKYMKKISKCRTEASYLSTIKEMFSTSQGWLG